ncbi:PAS domain-containing protein [Cytophagales bacterium LB-30]|uniref:histidine kinase n=1 Tax=Shiella aurantiaca TaxID=3058365 RepID=A0ABT8F4L2_9BACT|nr:PAS domain-containing protein [Shiella aurantiaca]MDN4165323.1 PAS domain-containing protein [Shiella aurantiaca]
MAKRKRGITYYLRIDFHTLQGKITGAFLSIALIATIMLVFNSYEWKKLVELNTHIAASVSRAKFYALDIRANAEKVHRLSLQYFATDDAGLAKEITTHLEQAQALSDSLFVIGELLKEREQNQYVREFLKEAQAVQLTQHDAIQRKDAAPLEEAIYQKALIDLASMQHLLAQHLDTIEKDALQYIERRMEIIPYLLWGQYLIAFLVSGIISSFLIINILKRIKILKTYIRELAAGALPKRLNPTKDELNTIVTALNELTDNLETITEFSKEVGKGNFNTEITVFNNENTLGESLANMRESLKRVGEKERNRTKINEGLAKFAELQRVHNDNIEELTDAVVSELVKYLNVNQGGIFVVEQEDGQAPYLQLSSSYAFERKKFITKRLEIGQGLVGQAFLEKEQIYLKEIPEDYVKITSGLGTSTPNFLLIVPMIYNDMVVGVIELASFQEFDHSQIEFVNKIASSIAASVSSVKINQETRKLLRESQLATEQLRAQEEEMRQNAEELEATQEEIHRQMRESNQQKEMFSSLLDNVEAIIYRSDYNQNWRKIYVNQTVEKLTGLRVSDLLEGRSSLMQAVHPEDLANLNAETANAVKQKKNFEVSYRLKMANGDYASVRDYGKIVFDGKGQVAFIDGVIQVIKG